MLLCLAVFAMSVTANNLLAQIYVRGSFTNWNTNYPMTNDNGVLKATVWVASGYQEFKFAPSDWSYSWGGGVGLSDTAVYNSGSNSNFTAPASGYYNIAFDTTSLIYSFTYTGGLAYHSLQYQMWAKGDFNSWGNTNQMSLVSDYSWKTSGITMDTGSYQMKFANTSDWSGDDWGNATGLSGTTTKTTGGGANLSFRIATAGTYDINFNDTTLAYSIVMEVAPKIVATSYDTSSSCESTNSISFKCSAGTAPYTVQLYRYGVAYGSPKSVAKTATFNTLPIGEYYATASSNGSSATGASKTVSIVPVPQNLSSSNITGGEAKLHWAALSCAKYFSIQYRVHGTTKWSKKQTDGNVTVYKLKNLAGNTKYDWEVAAADSANDITATGNYSSVQTFTTTGGSSSLDGSFDEDNLKQSNAQGVLVYPNPAVSELHVKLNTADKTTAAVAAYLKTGTGSIVWNASKLSSQNDLTIDVRKLPNGIYLLQIINADNSITLKKVIISK